MIKIAQLGLLSLLSVFFLFHMCVLIKLIPYKMVWGGRLKSDREMYRFEIFSLFMNSLLLGIILVHYGLLPIHVPQSAITICLWLMSALFLLNTLGNIASKNKLERRIFTPITILLTFFSLVLALTN